MHPVAVAEELKDVLRGRGIRRPDVASWLGPCLREILGVNETTTDEDARGAFVQLVRTHTARFPSDLRYVLLVGMGILVDHPFLEARLQVAETALDRSQRVLRRRLRLAEALLAEAIVQDRGQADAAFTNRGWQWTELNLSLRVGTAARLTLDRTLTAVTEHPRQIHESFVLAHPLEPGQDLEVVGDQGVRVAEIEHPSNLVWNVVLELTTNLARGQSARTVTTIHVPLARTLSPFLVLAPIRPAARATMSIKFERPEEVDVAWVIDRELPTAVASSGPPPSATPLTDAGLSAVFTNPRPGLAYGLAWRWAD